MDQNCDLYFPMPEQKKADRGEIKVILEIFKNTLSDLPFGNQEQAAKEIFDVLYKSNKIEIKDDERLALLNMIEEPAIQVLSGLREKIVDIAAPIGRNDERVAKILVGTHYELALAYRCLLDKPPVKGLLRTVDKPANADYIRLTIYHFGEILRTKYSVFSNPSGTIWKYIYTLFICAYHQQIHNLKLPPSGWCRFDTVEEVFKSILLMSISSPLTLRSSEFNALYDLAPQLTPYIELGKIECGENYSDLMTFNLSGTEPPKKQFATGCDSCSNASDCFAVSTTQLLNYFEQQQEQIEVSEQLSPVQRLLSTHGQSDILKQNLSGLERSGGAKRTKGGGAVVELVAGFSDICTYLGKGKIESMDDSEDDHAVDETDNWTTVGEEDITVEDTEAWTATGIIKAGLRKTTSKVINQSSGGYCLCIDASEKFHLRVGELVIVNGPGKSNWNAAVVIWVRGDKKRMDFGIKLLEGSLSNGTLNQIYSKETDRSINCLFLKLDNGDDDSSTRIITAISDLYKGDRISVNYLGNEYRVTVIKTNSKTNGYVEYICDWSDSGKDAATGRVVNPEGTVLNSEEAVLSDTDFESIWDQL